MRGYKAFNDDLTCKDFKYEVGKTYTIEGDIECCERGFHFCKELIDCFYYYRFGSRICEVEALGDLDTKYNKSCTSKIKIVRELSFEEICNKIEVDERLAKVLIESYNIVKKYKGFECVRLDGGWINGVGTGPFYWHLYDGSPNWNWYFGACLIKEEKRIIFREYYNDIDLWDIKIIDGKIKVDIKTDKKEYLELLEEIKNKTSVDFS